MSRVARLRRAPGVRRTRARYRIPSGRSRNPARRRIHSAFRLRSSRSGDRQVRFEIDTGNRAAYREKETFGEWCNGSTADSGSACLGSNPSSPDSLCSGAFFFRDMRCDFGDPLPSAAWNSFALPAARTHSPNTSMKNIPLPSWFAGSSVFDMAGPRTSHPREA